MYAIRSYYDIVVLWVQKYNKKYYFQIESALTVTFFEKKQSLNLYIEILITLPFWYKNMDENNTYHHIDHPENEEMFQSLNVNKGIPQPPTVNPHLGKYRKARRKYIGTSEYVERNNFV